MYKKICTTPLFLDIFMWVKSVKMEQWTMQHDCSTMFIHSTFFFLNIYEPSTNLVLSPNNNSVKSLKGIIMPPDLELPIIFTPLALYSPP